MLQHLQELHLGDCHEINPFDGYQYAPAGGERKAPQAHGEAAWVDPQRRQCASRRGRLAPLGIWIHRLSGQKFEKEKLQPLSNQLLANGRFGTMKRILLYMTPLLGVR